MSHSFIALDIETTGINPESSSIIEIGAIKIRDGVITEKFSELINPGVALSKQITSLTGITDEMLRGKREIESVLKEFNDFSKEDAILGHNILFDYSFLKVNMEQIGISYEKMGIDTLKISRVVHKEFPSRNLENMCKYYQIINEHAHRALEDARAAYLLYCKLEENFLNSNYKLFKPEQLVYKTKKVESITMKQKNYLNDLIKYHKIDFAKSISDMTKSEASKMIDKIILSYGKIGS